MSLAVSFLALSLSIVAGDPLPFVDTALVTSPVIRLGDVADLSALPPALLDRAAALEVADLGKETTAAVSARSIAERARRQMPGLAPWFDGASDQSIHIRVTAPETEAVVAVARVTPPCARLTRTVGRGEVVTASDFAPASCTEASGAAFIYDRRAGAMRAVRSLAMDDRVVRPPAFTLSAITPGQTVTVRASVGPVVVERDVIALQPAQEGQRLFVRSADGQVFTATAPIGMNGETGP